MFESILRDICRRMRVHLPDDLGWELEGLAARGIRVVFFFAREDAGRELLRLKGGSSVRRLGDQCRVHILDGADHIFTQRDARQHLLELLNAELTGQRAQLSPQSASPVTCVRSA